MLNKRVKSFGIIEAVIAIVIIVIMLVGVITLSSKSIQSTQTSSAYLEAEHIAGSILEQVASTKDQKKLDFKFGEHPNDLNNPYRSVDCFNTLFEGAYNYGIKDSVCDQVWAEKLLSASGVDGFYPVKSTWLNNPSFPPDYFSARVKVRKPADVGMGGRCRSTAGSGVTLPTDACRFIEVTVKWAESSGVKYHYQTEYFTNWESI